MPVRPRLANEVDPRRRLLLRSVATVLLGALLEACTLVPQGPSHVAQGRYYSSANPEYDAFFLSLYELQVRMGHAPIEYTELGNALAQDLNLPSDLTSDVLSTKLRERAQGLQRSGTRLLLVVRSEAGEPVPPDDVTRSNTATFLVDGNSGDGEVPGFTRAIERNANALLTFRQALVEDQAALERLGVRVIELESGVDSTFGPEGIAKVAEVDQNLTDAGKIIALMRARASALLERSGQRLKALVTATDTDDGRLQRRLEPPPATAEAGEQEQDEQEPPKPRPKRRSPTKRRARPKPPAPKPVAPATEFEP